MSASEKLRELLVAYENTDGWIPKGLAAQQTYLAALPQIVAVVEAAEWLTEGRSPLLPFEEPDDEDKLISALAALDEALTPQAGGER